METSFSSKSSVSSSYGDQMCFKPAVPGHGQFPLPPPRNNREEVNGNYMLMGYNGGSGQFVTDGSNLSGYPNERESYLNCLTGEKLIRSHSGGYKPMDLLGHEATKLMAHGYFDKVSDKDYERYFLFSLSINKNIWQSILIYL